LHQQFHLALIAEAGQHAAVPGRIETGKRRARPAAHGLHAAALNHARLILDWGGTGTIDDAHVLEYNRRIAHADEVLYHW